MAYKIALASSDGIVVNRHFGRAEKFQIYEINDAHEARFIEERPNVPSCQGFEHSEEILLQAVATIQDCKIVFVSQIGPGAYGELKRRGITAFEMPEEVQEIIEKLKRTNINYLSN